MRSGLLDLKLREIIKHFGSGLFLSLFSYLLSMAAVAEASRLALHTSWHNALLIGAVLGCISSSILLPVLQQVNLRREVKVTLLVESSLGDAFAVLAVTTLLDIASGGNAAPTAVAWTLGSSLILAVACGILAGILWSLLLPVLSEERFWHVLTFAAVLLVYSGVHFLKGNDLISVLVFGLTLTNFPAVRKRLRFDETAGSDWFTEMPIQERQGRSPDHHHNQMLTFHGELAFLLRTFFFVLLGMLVDFADLRKVILLASLCFAAILVSRGIVVQTGRLAWRTFSSLEREVMLWFVPRGLITARSSASKSSKLAATISPFCRLYNAFAVILLSNLTLLIGTVRALNLPPSAPLAT